MGLRVLHRWVGLATVLVFLLTGVYLRRGFPELHGGDAAVRFLYRANHVYLLFGGLVNAALGAYLTPDPRPGRRRLQCAGSALVLAAPAVLFAAFVREPSRASLVRPLTALGAVALLAGVAAHVAATAGGRPGGAPRD